MREEKEKLLKEFTTISKEGQALFEEADPTRRLQTLYRKAERLAKPAAKLGQKAVAGDFLHLASIFALRVHDAKSAIRCAKKALEFHRSRPLYLHLAICYESDGQLEKAKALMKKLGIRLSKGPAPDNSEG